jgi:hypothetical protein
MVVSDAIEHGYIKRSFTLHMTTREKKSCNMITHGSQTLTKLIMLGLVVYAARNFDAWQTFTPWEFMVEAARLTAFYACFNLSVYPTLYNKITGKEFEYDSNSSFTGRVMLFILDKGGVLSVLAIRFFAFVSPFAYALNCM